MIKSIIVISLAILLLAVAVVLLGVKVFFKKGGKFPSGHVHDLPALRDKGITCASARENND
ncbi:MAG: hypothetical protein K2K47_00475 [Duncaniella sp.]|nr:hypothetical protein [Duncaniella sp.]